MLTNFTLFIVVFFTGIRKYPDLIQIFMEKFDIEIFVLFLPVSGI
jgi:hypothetical protein